MTRIINFKHHWSKPASIIFTAFFIVILLFSFLPRLQIGQFSFGTREVRASTETFTIEGAYHWTAPPGIYYVSVECWGGGGGGGGSSYHNAGGGGGGGGAYSMKTIAVVPGTEYDLTVGAAGKGRYRDEGTDGGQSFFIDDATVMAVGGGHGGVGLKIGLGHAGAGGLASNCIGDIKYSGGNGCAGNEFDGGGGGGSGGTASNGNAATDLNGATAVTGGGPGGYGGNGLYHANGASPLSGPGGGGGGSSHFQGEFGGDGCAGKVVITYPASSSPNTPSVIPTPLPSVTLTPTTVVIPSPSTIPAATPQPTPTPTPVSTMTVLDLSEIIDENGVLQESLEGTVAQGAGHIKISEGTVALTNNSVPLSTINVQLVDKFPAPPADCRIIGLVYDFEPQGATFNPPANIIFLYDPASCPEGVNEKDLVISYYDVSAVKWIGLSSQVVTGAHIITAEVSHFTMFAIMGKATTRSNSGVNWLIVEGIIAAVAIIGVVSFLLARRRISTLTS